MEDVSGSGKAPLATGLAPEPLSEPPSTQGNAWDSYDTVFLNAKAGMDGVDKKKVQKVVYDMSKGSRYFDNEQRKDADVARKVDSMRAAAALLTPAQLADHEKVTDMKLAELEATRDLSRIWMHVDMDAFYAAVETLVNPTIAGKPMAVGGISMICTANYEARKFGVRAAMPGFIARKLCPDLIFVRPDFKKYSYYSDLTRKVFKDYDPEFVARSMDEAYIDVTNTCQTRSMSGAEIAEELRRRIQSETGLTCSAGVGPNRLLAKVCSDINKPNGQYVLGSDRGAVIAFISSLPIRKVSGIGKVTERLLKDVLGLTTCADLLEKRAYLQAMFSEISTNFFLSVALGIGGSDTPEKEHRKSLSNERTFRAICDEHQLFKKLGELVDLLVKDMEKEALEGRTLTLKLKETGFAVRSRAVTLPSFVSGKAEIWEQAAKLLRAELPLSLRLMGLRISHFKGEKTGPSDPSQRTLTGFVTQTSPASGIRNRQASKGSHKDNSLTSKARLDFPIDSPHASGGPGSDQVGAPASRIDEDTNPDSACLASDTSSMAPGDTLHQAAITPDLQSRPKNSPSTSSSTHQRIGAPAGPNSKAPNSVTVAESGRDAASPPLGRDGTGSTSRLFADESLDPTLAREQSPGGCMRHDAARDMSDGHVAQLQYLKPQMRQLDHIVTQDEALSSEAAVEPRGLTRADDESQLLIPTLTERIGNPSSSNHIGEELETLSDLTAVHQVTEPSWQELQSVFDESQDEQMWANDNNRCQLCGFEVDGLIPTARQEHEDFHFAVWLQQQKDEKTELQRNTTITTPSKKPSRETSSAGRKRKGPSDKRGHKANNKKTFSYHPLEAFFSKGK